MLEILDKDRERLADINQQTVYRFAEDDVKLLAGLLAAVILELDRSAQEQERREDYEREQRERE